MNTTDEQFFYVHRGNKLVKAFRKAENGDLVSYGIAIHEEEAEDFGVWFVTTFHLQSVVKQVLTVVPENKLNGAGDAELREST